MVPAHHAAVSLSRDALGRKDVLPAPLAIGMGVFALQREGQIDRAIATLQIFFVRPPVLPLSVVDNSGIPRSTSDDGQMQVLVTGSIDRERVCVSYSP
jgi:hypothetical protein